MIVLYLPNALWAILDQKVANESDKKIKRCVVGTLKYLSIYIIYCSFWCITDHCAAAAIAMPICMQCFMMINEVEG